MTNHKKVAKLLVKYGREVESEENDGDSSDLNPIEFFYGVIFDQGVRADLAWKAPKELRKRIHHLNPHKIAKMKESDLRRAIGQYPSLHRYRRKMPNWLIEASRLLVDRYSGDPKRIWDGRYLTGDTLQRRFDEFKGIGQKKASMATNILIRDYGIHVKGLDRSGIDVSTDVQVRRVFLRAGLIKEDDADATIRAAQRLNPKYPGELDLPAWYVGRRFCHPTTPECPKCPLTNACAKRTELGATSA